MLLVDKVLNVLNSLEGLNTVLYESPYFSNIKIDRKPSPYGILYLINVAELDLTNNLRESVEIEVFFCSTVNLDADGMKQQAVIDEMMPIAKQFIALMKQDKSIIIDDTIKLTSSYGKFDKNVTGVSVEMTIRDRQSKCIDSIDPEQRVLIIKENGEYDVTQYGKVVIDVVCE